MLFQPFAITLPIALLAKVTIPPRLVLQAIGLVGVYRRRILTPFTMGRHRFTALAALLLEPGTVIAPITLFIAAIVTPGLILEPPSVFRVDDRIERPHHRLHVFGRGGAPDRDRDSADRADKPNRNRPLIALQGSSDLLTARDNGRAAALFQAT